MYIFFYLALKFKSWIGEEMSQCSRIFVWNIAVKKKVCMEEAKQLEWVLLLNQIKNGEKNEVILSKTEEKTLHYVYNKFLSKALEASLAPSFHSASTDFCG